ncbi:hypothetical protein [Hydrogenophaga sp. NFH-34]|uniref:hypothetical protein n=1 Tax=Hydrogenophaga sp. NFH-34 TaxID=2744446 RepID=UPI001F338186|nr:hypothetical protein [Hydrogenophaga sp. NFH-34]
MLATKLDSLAIGPAPHEENPAQVGSENYARRSMLECAAFKAQILRHYPIPEDAIAGIRISLNPHEMGTYREVEVAYGDEVGCNWAYEVESDPKGALAKWDDESLAFLHAPA